jgi:hypothetical protein
MKLSDWRGELTFFGSNRSTVPVSECQGNFNEICSKLAPYEGPMVSNDKQNVTYFLPTFLKNAPLVGRTKEAAVRQGQSLEGKQRSAKHVTSTAMVVLDLDGVPGDAFKTNIRRLKSAGLAFLAFSSYSHGNPDKQGVRCRIIAPVDAPLDVSDYKKASIGFAKLFFGGQLDKTGTSLCQQQGVWATNPAWYEKNFKLLSPGSVADSGQLIAACPEQRFERASLKAPLEATSNNPFFNKERIRQALNWIDPRPYKIWLDTALFLKAAYGDESFELWLDWGNSAPKDILEGNVGNYAPELIWDTLEPFLEPDIGAGALFKTARGEADKVILSAIKSQNWTQCAKDGVGYLMRHHSRFFCAKYGMNK